MKSYDEVVAGVLEGVAVHRKRMKRIRQIASVSAMCAVCIAGLSVYLNLDPQQTADPAIPTATDPDLLTGMEDCFQEQSGGIPSGIMTEAPDAEFSSSAAEDQYEMDALSSEAELSQWGGCPLLTLSPEEPVPGIQSPGVQGMDAIWTDSIPPSTQTRPTEVVNEPLVPPTNPVPVPTEAPTQKPSDPPSLIDDSSPAEVPSENQDTEPPSNDVENDAPYWDGTETGEDCMEPEPPEDSLETTTTTTAADRNNSTTKTTAVPLPTVPDKPCYCLKMGEMTLFPDD